MGILRPGAVARMARLEARAQDATGTIWRATGHGSTATDPEVVYTAVPYRRASPAAGRLAAMAGGVAAADAETLYGADARVQAKDMLIDDADPTLRFHIVSVGVRSDGLVRTWTAQRRTGP